MGMDGISYTLSLSHTGRSIIACVILWHILGWMNSYVLSGYLLPVCNLHKLSYTKNAILTIEIAFLCMSFV
jgi:hypothetical protein